MGIRDLLSAEIIADESWMLHHVLPTQISRTPCPCSKRSSSTSAKSSCRRRSTPLLCSTPSVSSRKLLTRMAQLNLPTKPNWYVYRPPPHRRGILHASVTDRQLCITERGRNRLCLRRARQAVLATRCWWSTQAVVRPQRAFDRGMNTVAIVVSFHDWRGV